MIINMRVVGYILAVKENERGQYDASNLESIWKTMSDKDKEMCRSYYKNRTLSIKAPHEMEIKP